MDVSFEPTMAGSGWGGDVGEVSMTQAQGSTGSHFEKIPLPITISDAVSCATEDDKFHIDNYSFVNVRVCGRVSGIEEKELGERIIFLVDPVDENECSFKVILYETVQSKTEPYAEGDVVLVLGKIRVFDNEISMLAFHLEPINDEKRVECFLAEAALAQQYYKHNVPERISNGLPLELADTLFSNQPVSSRPKQGSDAASSGTNQHSGGNGFPGVTETQDARGLGGDRGKIYNIIHSTGDDSGIHIDQLRRQAGNMPSFEDELQYLINEGIIYTTIDDDHFSAI